MREKMRNVDKVGSNRQHQTLNLHKRTVELLDALAKHEGVPKSYLVDVAVREYAERHANRLDGGQPRASAT